MNTTEQPELRIGVKAFIKRGDGKYLLIKRSPVRYAFMADRIKWEIPGGRMEAGLTMIENLTKEIKEETNLDVISTPILLYAQDIFYEHKYKKQVVRLTFLLEASSTEIILDNEELSEYKWVTKEELINESEIDEYVKEVLEKKGDLI